MKRIQVNIPEGQLELIDQLINAGIFPNRNEAITEAIRDLLKYHHKL
jgi:Arc/MetJ-type ribon-helix-helix transcriptional regulator